MCYAKTQFDLSPESIKLLMSKDVQVLVERYRELNSLNESRLPNIFRDNELVAIESELANIWGIDTEEVCEKISEFLSSLYSAEKDEVKDA